MKLITSTALQEWGKTRESQEKLPLLLRRLIVNDIGFNNILLIDIPGGDSIWKPGVDGKFIPKQTSILGEANKTYIIECGQSGDADKKFKDDLKKRTNKLNGQKTDAVFVFMTAHKWRNKADTVNKVKETVENSNLWSEIKTFDADDIENWLEHDFATTAWLADILRKPSNGVKGFDSTWENWRDSTIIPIDEDLILARKDIHSEEINQWFQENSSTSILKIKSANRKESLLFLMSSILKSQLDKETIDSLKSQIVIVENEDIWKQLVEYKETKKLILIPYFGIPENLGTLINKGYKVFIPMGEEDGKSNEPGTIYIEPFNTHILYPILEIKIKSHEKTYSLIQKLGNNGTLLHLQRLLEREEAPLPTPKWADKDNWEILLLAAFAGRWNERNAKDKEAITDLFGLEYSEITRKLSLYIKTEEAPVRKNGYIWKVSTPEIIVEYLARYLTEDVFTRYLTVTKKILSVINQKYDKSTYSDGLIDGICQGYAIISNKANIFDAALGVKENIQHHVVELFKDKDWKTWATLSRNFSSLAEAAPNGVLELLEKMIQNNQQIIKDIYLQSVYVYILPAMEVLAWVDLYFPQAVQCLFGLNIKWGNSPLESLERIFCPWYYINTMVSLDDKKQFLDTLIKDGKNIDAVFSLLYSLFLKDHLSTQSTRRPRFIKIIEPPLPAEQDLLNFHYFIFQKALSILENDAARWSKMVDYIDFMDMSCFDRFIEKLNAVDWRQVSVEFKKTIYQKLNHWLLLNDDNKEKREYAKKEKSIEAILSKLETDDPIDKNIQLFSNDILTTSYIKDDKTSSFVLKTAIKDIIDAKGISGIIEFAKQIDNPDILGYELAYADLSKEDIKYVLNTQKRSDGKIKQLIGRFFAVIVSQGISFLNDIFDMEWDNEYKKFLLCNINNNKSYWDWLETKTLSELYWSNVGIVWAESDAEYEMAIQQLDKFKNYLPMLCLIYKQEYSKNLDRVKTSDIVKVLYGIAASKNSTRFPNIRHESKTLFDILQKRQDVDEQKLFQLEVMHFKLFDEHNGLEPKTIYKYLRTKPEFFIEILNMTFRSEKDIELYVRLGRVFPFSNENEFKQWIGNLMPLLNSQENKDLVKIGMQQIGKMLANSPKDPQDNIWPIKYVRVAIEKLYDDDLKAGIRRGKISSVGARSIDMKDPGGYWLKRVSEFRENANKIRFTHPRTSAVLDYIATDYDCMSEQYKQSYCENTTE
ncbi:MAG: hypothetical protein LBT18_05445 [Endomicrobium sp.]|jgi:hypothetical protein|nr:hypothetical protein [Endomicrobium sp.]